MLFQTEFRRITQRNVQLPLKQSVLLKTYVVLPVLLIVMNANAFLVLNGLRKWWHGIPFSFGVAHFTLLVVSWVIVCSAISHVARDIIQDIGKVRSSIIQHCIYAVYKFIVIWDEAGWGRPYAPRRTRSFVPSKWDEMLWENWRPPSNENVTIKVLENLIFVGKGNMITVL